LAGPAKPFGGGTREADRGGQHDQTGATEKSAADARPFGVFGVETVRVVRRESIRGEQNDETASGTVRRPETGRRVRAETVPGQRGGRQRPTTLFELPTVGRADTENVSVFRGQETLAGRA